MQPTTHQGRFQLHCQIAHYQTAIWKATGVPSPTPGFKPLDCGWYEQGTMLEPLHGLPGELPGSKAVLDLGTCSYKKGCNIPHCTCIKRLPPCALCRAEDCAATKAGLMVALGSLLRMAAKRMIADHLIIFLINKMIEDAATLNCS